MLSASPVASQTVRAVGVSRWASSKMTRTHEATSGWIASSTAEFIAASSSDTNQNPSPWCGYGVSGRSEKPEVGESIPPLTTNKRPAHGVFVVLAGTHSNRL